MQAMFRAGFALTMACLVTSNALAQSAPDQCRDVLEKAVFDTLKVDNQTFYSLSYLFNEKRSNQESRESNLDASGGFEGLYGSLSTSDKASVKNELSKHIDLRVLYEMRTSILLQTGQAGIVQAWKDCMISRGGGPSVYFTVTKGQPDLVDLHIENVSGNSFGSDLTIADDVFIRKNFATVENNRECIKKGRLYKVGDQCTVKLAMPSAWSYGKITVSFTNNQITRNFEAYLAPRAQIKREVRSWPSREEETNWNETNKAPHKNNVQGINRIVLYRQGSVVDPSRGQSDLNRNCHRLSDDWLFVEGKRRLMEPGKSTYESDSVRPAFTFGGKPESAAHCKMNWEIRSENKEICIGGSLGTGMNPNAQSCEATLRAEVVRYYWEPSPPASTNDKPTSN
jgi:hypothetical protein